jgi:hypothetical protein
MTTYDASGPVRGDCGHQHRTAGAAWRCCHADNLDCGRLGGGCYSDREVRRADGAELTEGDIASIEAAQEAVYGY